jgi:hypothetical protein
MPEKEAQDAGLAKVDLASVVIDDNSSMDKAILNPKKEIVQRDEEVRFLLLYINVIY